MLIVITGAHSFAEIFSVIIHSYYGQSDFDGLASFLISHKNICFFSQSYYYVLSEVQL